MTIDVTFDTWRRAVDVYLDRVACPRPLCDMPQGVEGALWTWFRFGVRAWVVALCLSACVWPGRATLDADPLVPTESRACLLTLRATFTEL